MDPQDDALKLCADANVLGNIRKSDVVPYSLPLDGNRFDLSFAFSVFTHLSPKSAAACLGAIRKSTVEGGLLMATVWPPEIWTYFDNINNTAHADELIGTFSDTGYAYRPRPGEWGKTYGNATVAFDFFEKNGWSILGYEPNVNDAFQITLILRKK